MDTILDFSKSLDIVVLDKVVAEFYQGNMEYQKTLVQFREHPQAWTRADAILEKSQNPNTKMLALNVLESVVSFRWQSLPADQRNGIKQYIVGLIIKISSDVQVLQQQSVLITKLNLVLVQIVKQDWPQNWPSFIPDLVNSSKKSQSLCTNNMAILLLLSEEIFDFSSGKMTQAKMKTMKKSLNSEFTLIFQLCDYILDNSQDQNLLSTTLRTLLRFLHWIPVGFIFETKLIHTLAVKFFPVKLFQNPTLECLSEIGTLQLNDRPQYNPKFVQLFMAVIEQVSKLLTPETDLAAVFASSNKGNEDARKFVRHLTIFITGFLKAHRDLLERGDDNSRQALLAALKFLGRISKVDDIEIFKICLEYWQALVADLYTSEHQGQRDRAVLRLGTNPKVSERVKLYQPILTPLRPVLISKMAKPEEVLIVEDENGQIVRETYKDTDSITLYKNMREALIYLTHLDPSETQETMLLKLSKQVDGTEWSWNNLNTLCWAIGSISGALTEMAEKRFLVRVIKDLLGLCEMRKGKDTKAVIASNIMYVVGQYPRFLRQHWKFLKTVVNKLFEFMHERHPGVQDMSCDTFLKISRRCRRKFVLLQNLEDRTFIEEMLEGLPDTIADLEESQIHTFYEAMGCIIQAESDPSRNQAIVFKLMSMPNQLWSQVIASANQNRDMLFDLKTVKQVVMLLKTNNRVAKTLGHGYAVQLSRVYMEVLQVYKMYSGYISGAIKRDGAVATKTLLIRSMRAVKRETLKLIQEFINNCQQSDQKAVYDNFLPALMDPVLDDYQRNVAPARDAEVLMLFATVINKLGDGMTNHVPRIFESVFQCTLDMITKNFQDFPDHRISFFKLLRAINSKCFPALLRLNPQQFQLVIDSVVWAFKHLEKNIADTGLNILLELAHNVEHSEVANDFFKRYFISLTTDLLGALTDTFHRPGFQLHATILAKLFNIVETGVITAPLWSAEQGNYPNNQVYVKQVVAQLVKNSFPNLRTEDVEKFVLGLFTLNSTLGAFKNHLRDFLVQSKEFNAEDNADLFAEEKTQQTQNKKQEELQRVMNVPGLLYTGPSGEQQQQQNNNSGRFQVG